MTTIGDLVSQVIYQWLEPGRRHIQTRLTTTIDSDDTTITFDYDISASRGSVIAIDDELILVWAFDVTANAITDCQRGYQGTTAGAHTAGTLTEMGARFPRGRVLQTLKNEIDGWGADLYQIIAADFTGVSNQSAIDLTSTPDLTTAYGLVDARIRRSNVGVVEAVSAYDRWPRPGNPKLVRNMPTASFPSGIMLKLGEILQGPASIRVMAAMPFVTSTFTEATNLSTVGLEDSYADVACLGAAVRLLYGQESDRTDRSSVGEARRAQEVTVGQTYQEGSLLERTYLRRLDAEKAKLISKYPIRYA